MGPKLSITAVPTVGARTAAGLRSSELPLAWLVFGDGSVWPVHRSVVLGRCPNVDTETGDVDVVAFDDPTMSRRHLLVDLVGEHAPCFVDLDSRSGSHVSAGPDLDTRLRPRISARDGVEVSFGQTSVRWLSNTMGRSAHDRGIPPTD